MQLGECYGNGASSVLERFFRRDLIAPDPCHSATEKWIRMPKNDMIFRELLLLKDPGAHGIRKQVSGTSSRSITSVGKSVVGVKLGLDEEGLCVVGY